MKNKIVKDVHEAVVDIHDGATVMVGGFTGRGVPSKLLLALRDKGPKNLTVIRNDASGGWNNPVDVDVLIKAGMVKKVITCFASFGSPKKISALEQAVLDGITELELSPQGSLVERIRAAGSGLGAFYTPVGAGTLNAKGKETRKIDGKEMLLEYALHADFALIHTFNTDKMGNSLYRMSARNFNPIMAMAAKVTIAEAENIVEVGEIDPENVITPAIFVNKMVHVPRYSYEDLHV